MKLTRAIRRRSRQLLFRTLLAPPLVGWYDRWSSPRRLGDRGEIHAARYLLKQGWVLIERGYEDAIGEIDLIAVDDDTLVFVEVKTRTSWEQGHPAEAVDLAKQEQISKVALSFRRWHRLPNVRIRFDVIAITWPAGARIPRLEHFVHAFESADDNGLV